MQINLKLICSDMLSLFTYYFQLLSEAIVDIHILWYEYHPQYHNSYQPIKRDRFKANKICEKFILSKEQWVERENYDTIIWFHEVYTHLLMLEKNYIYFSNTMKRRNHFKSNENSVYSNLQGNEEQTYGNLTAWDFPLYGRNSSLVAKIL